MTLYAIESQRLGLALESSRGTAESAPTKWYPTRGQPELNFELQHLEDEALRGSFAPYGPVEGQLAGEGSIPFYCDAQMLGEPLYSLLGGLASAEDSVITIDATNNKLDFDIGGGELNATIASASYAIGTASSEAGTLCAAIKTAMETADVSGTYTITYSRSTKLFTIARSTGAFSVLWKTGTNGSDNLDTHIGTTIGFDDTADDTSAASQVGDNQIEYAFTHTYTVGTNISKPAYTLFVDRSISVKKYNLAVCKRIEINSPVDGLVEVGTNWVYKNEASGSIGSPSFPTQRYMAFQTVDFKIAGASNTKVKEFNLAIDNQAFGLRTLNTTQLVEDVIAAAKIMIEGGFTVYFESETERDKYLANTSVSIRILMTGATINGSSAWTLDINVYGARYKAYNFTDDSGLLASKVQFKGYYSASDAKALQVLLTNQDMAYA